MKLAKYISPLGKPAVGLVQDDHLLPLALSSPQFQSLSEILEADDPAQAVRSLLNEQGEKHPLSKVHLLPPVDRQEIWAAGVTYKRSQVARMEESVSSATVYDRVYTAARPELFFKSMPHKAVGTLQPVRIRQDSKWNVPEPELALVINSRLQLVGFTVGNDMSSRDIEGENPLYLPQAKVYDQSCAVGPWITLAAAMPPRPSIGIRLQIDRAGKTCFEGQTSVEQMARQFEDLIQWLGRDNALPDGAILLTGTGVVPDSSFTLLSGDVVHITIDGIGTLTNTVVQRG